MFLKTPSLFLGGAFYIYGATDENNTLLRSFIELACRNSHCTGFVSEAEAARELPVICGEPNALSIEIALDEPLRSNWYTIPVPHSDIWSYWEIGKKLLPYLDTATQSSALKLPREALLRFLASYRPGNHFISGGQFTWNQSAYLNGIIDYHQRDMNQVNYVLGGLSNWRSRQILYTVLADPASRVWDMYFSSLFSKVQYMSYIELQPGDTVINAGIHKGPEIPFFLNAIQGRGQIHNIDPLGYRFLSNYTASYFRNHADAIVEHDVALADYNGEISFPIGGEHDQALGGMAGKSLQGCETRSFPCVRLSTLVQQLELPEIALLKFDLEGAETSILSDVIAVATRFRPQIAISIYHSPTDYIEIPQRLMAELSGYDFYVEHYSFERYETVLYCIPSERSMARKREILLDIPIG